MNNHDIPRQKSEAELKVDALLEKLKTLDIDLEHETDDQEQLKPSERIESIYNVWLAIKDRLNNPETALDVGSGFGYGVAVLDTKNIKTIGIENVPAKNKQALALFDQLDVALNEIDEIDFENSPAIMEAEFDQLDQEEVADLITMFYLSQELITKPETFEICQKLLKKDGQMVLATEADRASVEQIIASGAINLPAGLSYEIIDLPGNFEQTIILLNKN
ncbi:MAG: hypothetical protein HOE19_00715 [Candidatus Komeilibacteria bacterium]|jgi:hypothetical protein|nr:hypothetical protein [Candidatus Komeilibacteria bacterium]MBT4447348.1 hypothetical protein [Candidatus Komeilibacteria bacterium]